MVLLVLVAGAPAVAARTTSGGTDPSTPSPLELPSPPAAVSPGDSGRTVAVLQRRLEAAGFRPGDVDGEYGAATLGAVYAFQKVHDLPRDGVFRPEHWEYLAEPIRLPGVAGAPDRVEVDLAKQILYLIGSQRVKTVLPISSGNGEMFRNAGGALVGARTPEGSYAFYTHIDGWRISYLGGLYRPFYFRGGYAIHGSYSVPPYPASHGCVRVELWDMDYLTTELELGMPVYLYGQRLTRKQVVYSEVPSQPVNPRQLLAIS